MVFHSLETSYINTKELVEDYLRQFKLDRRLDIGWETIPMVKYLTLDVQNTIIYITGISDYTEGFPAKGDRKWNKNTHI